MTRGYAALTTLICALWASVGIVTKLCLAEAPPFGLASIRMLIAALALWFWIKVRRHERQDWSCWPILMVATALFCSLLAFTHLGFNLTSAASGIVLLNTTPLFVAVVAFAANKEPISLAKASGLVLAFIGVVTIFADRVGGVGESITGDAFMLVAAISWSFQILWTKQAARGVDAGLLTLAQFTGAALVLGVRTHYDDRGSYALVPHTEVGGGYRVPGNCWHGGALAALGVRPEECGGKHRKRLHILGSFDWRRNELAPARGACIGAVPDGGDLGQLEDRGRQPHQAGSRTEGTRERGSAAWLIRAVFSARSHSGQLSHREGRTRLNAAMIIRPFEEEDATAVRELFVTINRLLSPLQMRDAFEAYISRSLAEEMDRINEYYNDRKGGFWVAARSEEVVGMFGLEPASPDSLELRRMYVAPSARRAGIARSMLGFAEEECRRRQVHRLELSTSELQPAAVELYKGAGYQLLQEAIVEQASNKTVGGGIRRYYFEKYV